MAVVPTFAPMAMIIQEFGSPFGTMILGDYEGKIGLCDWKHRSKRSTIDERIKHHLGCKYSSGATALLETAKNQLHEYFAGIRTDFDLPLILAGTAFQEQVWNALRQIHYGQTVSYLQLAKTVKNEKAVRAVAAANGANALSILIPCHRVIGANGALVGYAGGERTKSKLLALEMKPGVGQLKLF